MIASISAMFDLRRNYMISGRSKGNQISFWDQNIPSSTLNKIVKKVEEESNEKIKEIHFIEKEDY